MSEISKVIYKLTTLCLLSRMGGLETYLQKTEHEEWKSLKNFLQLSSAGGGGGLLFFGWGNIRRGSPCILRPIPALSCTEREREG